MLRDEIQEHLVKFDSVLEQTERRVFAGEKVHAREKLYSIFEDHTDIIQKGGRDTVFGHKICFGTGKSKMILDCIMERGNPNDTTYFRELLERHAENYGQAPWKTACDGGFYSKANADYAKEIGVRDVFFSKGTKKKLLDYVRSSWIYKQLRRFRNGVEACISWLKRCFGLERCNWSGWESFQSYVWSGIVAYNLNIIASHSTE
jgi:IS5 family transposase